MSQFDTAIEATNTSLSASGATMEQNEVYMEGLEAQTNLLKNQFQELVIGDGGLEKLMIGLVETGTEILKFIDDTNLLKVAFVDLAIIAGVNLIPEIISLAKKLKTAEVSYTWFSASVVAGNEAMQLSIPIIGLVLAGISALVIGVNKYISVQKEQIDSLKSLTDIYKEEADSYADVLNLLNSESLSRADLDTIINSNLSSYVDEFNAINDLNDARDLAINKIKQEQIEKANLLTSNKDNFEAYEDAIKKLNDKDYSEWIGSFGDWQVIDSTTDGLQAHIDALSKYKEELENSGGVEKYQDEIMQIDEAIQDATYNQSIYLSVIEEFNDALKIQGYVYDTTTEKIRLMTEAELNLYNVLQGIEDGSIDTSDVISRQMDMMADTTDTIDDLEESLEEYESALESLETGLEALDGIDLSDLESTISLVSQAMEEMYSAKGMSVDTYNALLSLDEDYISVLLDENGALRNTADAQNALYMAKIDDMAITQSKALIEKAVAMANDESSISYAELTEDVQNRTIAGWEEVEMLMAKATLSDADASAVQNQINTIKDWASQAKDNIGIYRSTTSATEDTTSATDDLTDSLEDLKDQYEDVFSYIEDRIDSYIDKLESQKDAELDAIDAQIEALEEQNDALSDQISLQEKLEAIAEARSQKVIVLTEDGWAVQEDSDAVATAQAEYDALALEQEQDAEIQALEDYRDEREAIWDAQIQSYEDYVDNFTQMTNEYEDEQTRLLAEQLTGLDMENDMWITRLDNLSSFVNNYNSILSQLGGTTTSTSSSDYSGSTSDAVSTTTTSTNSFSSGGTKVMQAYASGVASVSGNQIAITGEGKNKEIVLGSNLNSGVFTSIDNGGGVINAESTSTLAGLVNSLGKYASSNGVTSAPMSNIGGGSSNTWNISNISLPSVQNGQDFVEYMQMYATQMTQESYA